MPVTYLRTKVERDENLTKNIQPIYLLSYLLRAFLDPMVHHRLNQSTFQTRIVTSHHHTIYNTSHHLQHIVLHHLHLHLHRTTPSTPHHKACIRMGNGKIAEQPIVRLRSRHVTGYKPSLLLTYLASLSLRSLPFPVLYNYLYLVPFLRPPP